MSGALPYKSLYPQLIPQPCSLHLVYGHGAFRPPEVNDKETAELHRSAACARRKAQLSVHNAFIAAPSWHTACNSQILLIRINYWHLSVHLVSWIRNGDNQNITAVRVSEWHKQMTSYWNVWRGLMRLAVLGAAGVRSHLMARVSSMRGFWTWGFPGFISAS